MVILGRVVFVFFVFSAIAILIITVAPAFAVTEMVAEVTRRKGT